MDIRAGLSGSTYVAHLSHDGLLFLTEVVLVVFRNLLVQVLMDLQHLMDIEINVC